MTTLSGTLITPQGQQAASLSFSTTISSITPTAKHSDTFILPGFIDSHVHGGAGGDAMDGSEAVATLARFHLQHGTTTLYPTTITNPWENIITALKGVKVVMAEADPSLPSMPGVHLEGPFISPDRLGAQPPFAVEPSAAQLAELLALDVIKLVTLAPEVKGVIEAARRFAESGVRISIGHTVASYEQTAALIDVVKQAGGVVGFTHLYNAMTAMGSRAPGVVGAALADSDSYAELILDTHHVHHGSFLAAYHAKPEHLQLITDSIRACGLGEGESQLGGQRVLVKDGAARLADGTLAGSVLTLDQALRHALEAGLSVVQVSRLLSATPARYLGLSDRGTLELGKRADVVILDRQFRVLEVYVAGRKLVG